MSSKYHFKQHYYIDKRHRVGEGIFSTALGAIGAYKTYQGAKSAVNWIGNKASSLTTRIKANPIYEKTANFLNPNRNFYTPKTTTAKFGEQLPTAVINNVPKQTLQIKGREAPLLNSDPFRIYTPDPNSKTGYSVTNTPLRDSIINKPTNDQKQTESLLKRVNYETKYQQSVQNPVTGKFETVDVKEPTGPLLNPFIKASPGKRGKTPGQLLLDRIGKGLDDINNMGQLPSGIKKRKNDKSLLPSNKKGKFVTGVY